MAMFLFFSRYLRVLKWCFLFDERRGLTTAAYSLSAGGDSSWYSLTNWPFPTHTHALTNTHNLLDPPTDCQFAAGTRQHSDSWFRVPPDS
jgi:hypothetical protein